MLINEALHEARRLQSSLRAMHVDRATLDEADLLSRALQHDPVENVLPFALDALERIDDHLPAGTLAGLVRVRIRSLVGTLQAISDRRAQVTITHGAALTPRTLQQAAINGAGTGCLSPSQAWAAWRLAIPVERLQQPLSARVARVLDRVRRLGVTGQYLAEGLRANAR
ncbi:hypothetical protein [Halomonas chromatireducens]|uniref:Uncharacterized protein n=1 Tax=Halomonas chromatireducens TaxID=507626 RepID=A0A0X8HH57_9GAMM|nr:hypothetical protein [Halomonas chromatireducens]AMD02495.1 hypothetical protein LOKO_03455 [Halomonas chromatireducens]